MELIEFIKLHDLLKDLQNQIIKCISYVPPGETFWEENGCSSRNWIGEHYLNKKAHDLEKFKLELEQYINSKLDEKYCDQNPI